LDNARLSRVPQKAQWIGKVMRLINQDLAVKLKLPRDFLFVNPYTLKTPFRRNNEA